MEYFAVIVLLLGCFGGALNIPQQQMDLMSIISLRTLQACPKRFGGASFTHIITEIRRRIIRCTNDDSVQSALRTVGTSEGECEEAIKTFVCIEPLLDAVGECYAGDKESNAQVWKAITLQVLKEALCGSLQNFNLNQVDVDDQCNGVTARLKKCQKATILHFSAPLGGLTATECRSVAEHKSCLKEAFGHCYDAALLDLMFDSVITANECHGKLTSSDK